MYINQFIPLMSLQHFPILQNLIQIFLVRNEVIPLFVCFKVSLLFVDTISVWQEFVPFSKDFWIRVVFINSEIFAP